MGVLAWLTSHPVIGLIGALLAVIGVYAARLKHAQAKARRERAKAIREAMEASEALRRAERVRIEAERTGIAPEVIRAQIDALEASEAAKDETAEKNAIRRKWQGFKWPTR